QNIEPLCGGFHIFVTAAAQAHENDGVWAKLSAELYCSCKRMRRLDSRDDALCARQQSHGIHRRCISHRQIPRSAKISKPTVLRADTRIVETRGNRVRLNRLAVVILEEVAAGTVEHSWPSLRNRCRVSWSVDTVSRCFKPIQRDSL